MNIGEKKYLLKTFRSLEELREKSGKMEKQRGNDKKK